MKAASWHGRLALFYGPLVKHQLWDIDICTYTKAVLTGSWRAALVAAGLAFVAVCATSSLFWVWFYLVEGFKLSVDHDIFAVLGLIIPYIAIACVIAVLWLLIMKAHSDHRNRRRNAEEAKRREPGFLEQAADAKLNKYCFKLSFADIGKAPIRMAADTFDSRF